MYYIHVERGKARRSTLNLDSRIVKALERFYQPDERRRRMHMYAIAERDKILYDNIDNSAHMRAGKGKAVNERFYQDVVRHDAGHARRAREPRDDT